MYKKHKVICLLTFVIVSFISYKYKLDPQNMASDILTITAIILGFYITALSTLFGNKVIKNMAKKQDKQLRSKTELGVLLSYYKISIVISFATIITSIISILLCNKYTCILMMINNIIASLMLGLVFVSLYLMFILLKLFFNLIKINGLTRYDKEKDKMSN